MTTVQLVLSAAVIFKHKTNHFGAQPRAKSGVTRIKTTGSANAHGQRIVPVVLNVLVSAWTNTALTPRAHV